MTEQVQKRSELVELQQAVISAFERFPMRERRLHNYYHSYQIVNCLTLIGRTEALPESKWEILFATAWLYDLYQLDPTCVEQILKSIKHSKTVLEGLKDLSSGTLQNVSYQLVKDAILAVDYGEAMEHYHELRILDRKERFGIDVDKIEALEELSSRLSDISFSSTEAKIQFAKSVEENYINVQAAIQRQNRREQRVIPERAKKEAYFSDIETRIPDRAIQTFFRTNYRNHINLSAIADNKANIMISVNAILISILITFLSYQCITDQQPMILMPIVIFLVAGLTSLTFAVLSARPKVTSVISKDQTRPSKNIVFFGNFVHLELDDYEKAMDEMFRSGQLIYGNMTRDLYYLGKVLDKKYHYLKYSYNIFMLGFVTTVLIFLFIFLSL